MKKILSISTLLMLIGQMLVAQQQPLNKQQLVKLDAFVQTILPKNTTQTAGISVPYLKPIGYNKQQEPIYQVIVFHHNEKALRQSNLPFAAIQSGIATARLTPTQILLAAQMESIDFVSRTRTLQPLDDEANGYAGIDLVHNGIINNTNYKGQGVLIGIIDSGLDFRNKDFRKLNDTTKSRVVAIWDQTLTKIGSETTPKDLNPLYNWADYGVEYTQTQLNNEIDGSPINFVRHIDTYYHGTGVASMAASNGGNHIGLKVQGAAPEADLIIVKNNYEDAQIIDGIAYIKQKALQLNRPVVLNLSLGGQYGGHDGTAVLDSAVNNFVNNGSAIGRVVAVAAGNSRQIICHKQGTVNNNDSTSFLIKINPYTPRTDTNAVGYTVWFDNSNDITAKLTSPTGQIFNIPLNQTIFYPEGSEGKIIVENRIQPNHVRYIDVAFTDSLPAILPKVKDGNWTLMLYNPAAGGTANVGFHAWAYLTYGIGSSPVGGDGNYTIASPATATHAIAVGMYALKNKLRDANNNLITFGFPELSDSIAFRSSRGPRRDGINKPDITAAGELVFASLSRQASISTAAMVQTNKHYRPHGTSFAAPVVAGVLALMLQVNPNLTASQLKTYLLQNTLTDEFTGALAYPSTPSIDWGYGKVDAFKAVSRAASQYHTHNRAILRYDQWNGRNINNFQNNP